MESRIVKDLKHWMPYGEMKAVMSALKGEEKEGMKQTMREIVYTMEIMPATYATDGQGDRAVAHLHYFLGGSDWYITERDINEEQEQAFGLAILHEMTDCAEMGYINISELIENGAELDLYWHPLTIAEIKKEKHIN